MSLQGWKRLFSEGGGPGLTIRIVTFTFFLAAVPLILVAIFSFRAGSRGIQAHTESHLRSVVLVKAQEVERWFRPLEAAAHILANSPDLVSEVANLTTDETGTGFDPAEFNTILDESVRSRIGLNGIAIISTDLRTLFSSTSVTSTFEPSSILLYPTNKSSVTLNLPPYVKAEQNPQAMILAPLLSKDTVIAYLVIFASPIPLYETFTPDAGLGREANLYIVNNTGEILTPILSSVVSQNTKLTSDIVGLTGNTALWGAEYVNFADNEVVAAYLPLQKLGLGIVVEQPVSVAFADISQMRLTIVVASTVFFFLTLAAATIISRRITKPVKTLAIGAHEIGEGNLDYRIHVSSKDELGLLAESFNKMASALNTAQQQMVEAERATALQMFTENKIEQLQLLNRLGILITEEVSLKGLAEHIPTEAKKISGAELAVLAFLDEYTGQVEHLGHTHVSDPQVVRELLKDEHFLANLAEGRAIRYYKGDGVIKSSGASSTSIGLFASLLILPVRAGGGETAGAIVLGNLKGQEEFSQEDQELMQIVADYTSSALQKIRKETRLQQSEQTAVNALDELKSTQEQLIQAQKMESIGKLAGGVAHDFNNLLTPIMAYAEMGAGRLPHGDKARSQFEEIHKAGERASNLVGQLLAFSRRQLIEPKVVNLNDIIEDLEKMLRRLIGEDIELITHKDEKLSRVKVDPGQMDQLLINFCVNARDAMPSGGRLVIETSNFTLDEFGSRFHDDMPPGQYVLLSVSDNGTGMTEEVKSRVFEPFFTTKGPGKGTGLGLSTCYGIAKQNNGSIAVRSEIGHGTTLEILLPVTNDEPVPYSDAFVSDNLPRGTETVLWVEDEKAVQEIGSMMLREQGYNVIEASNGAEALDLVNRRPEQEIDLLFTDVVMPEMGGNELAKQIKENHQSIKVLFTSGYTDDAIMRHGMLEPGINFIQKPLTLNALANKVRDLLDERVIKT